MKEYIERDAVIRLIQTEGYNEKYDLGHPKDNDWFCEEVNRIPAADVVERPHWIPVTERLPEEPYGCLLIVWDSPYDGGDDFLNYLPYFAGWDGEQWNDEDGIQVPFEVVYWMPLPELPKEET